MTKPSPAPEFPRNLAELDAVWLTQALRASGAISGPSRVAGLEAHEIGGGLGQTGAVGRIALEYAGGGAPGPASLIVKSATEDPRRRKASMVSGLYARGTAFYARFSHEVAARAPRCHFAAIDDEEEYFLLLLEDFPRHRAGDQIAGVGREDAELSVDQLARLHAPFWGRAPAPELPPPVNPPLRIFAEGWDEMARTFGHAMSPAFHALRDAYLDSVAALFAWRTTGRLTLLHGDFKADNLLFGPPGDPDPVVALDWQAVGFGKPAFDLAYFITHNMTESDRKAHEQDLIRLYCGRLQALGVDHPLQEALDDYRTALAALLSYAIWICGVNVNPHPRAMLRKEQLMGRISSSVEDWALGELLPLLAVPQPQELRR